MRPRSAAEAARLIAPGLTGWARPTIALVLSWACCAVLLADLGPPVGTAAGLLLTLVLPGWLVAEAAFGRNGGAPERWATMILGASLCFAIVIGVVVAATGDLQRQAVAAAWLGVTSILGVVVVIGRRDWASRHSPSLLATSTLGPTSAVAVSPAPTPDPPAAAGNLADPAPDLAPWERVSLTPAVHLSLEEEGNASVGPERESPLTIAVVICAYAEDRWLDLVAAVTSLRSQSKPPTAVVVVIDNDPKLLARAQSELTNATVVPNTQRPGLAGARNCGVARTSSEVVAFLDDDARADPDWIAELTRAYASSNVMGVGGRIDPEWRVDRPTWFPEEFNWVVGCSYRGLPTSPTRIRNLIGANMSMRRSVFDAVAGFRQELGRLEDTDLCIRATRSEPGGIWLYWPGARITHSVSASRATWSFFTARCYNEGVAKASMVALTGRQAGLQSERDYVRRVLPTGMLRESARVMRLDVHGPQRAMAIACGLGYTVVGYMRGRFRHRLQGSSVPVHIPRRGNTP